MFGYILDPKIAPFPVKPLPYGYVQTTLTHLNEYLKTSSNGNIPPIDALHALSTLESLGIPFNRLTGSWSEVDQGERSEIYIKWLPTGPFTPNNSTLEKTLQSRCKHIHVSIILYEQKQISYTLVQGKVTHADDDYETIPQEKAVVTCLDCKTATFYDNWSNAPEPFLGLCRIAALHEL